MKILKQFICIFIVFLLLINTSMISYADETTNDVLYLYGLAEKKAKREVIDKFNDKLADIEGKLAYEEKVIYFNQFVDENNKSVLKIKETKMNEVNNLLTVNSEISNYISTNIYGDWNTLISYYNDFKHNEDKITKLLDDINNLVLLDKLDSNTVDWNKELNELEELSKEMYVSDNSIVLGDVSTLHQPLNLSTFKVTSNYGARIDPMTGSTVSYHNGLDLRAPEGTEVLSTFNGTIVDTGYNWAGGNYVRISHGDGLITYYCHLSQIKCVKGQKVNQYDVIALSGNTGARTTGPHLHWGVYINGNSVDPYLLISNYYNGRRLVE